MSKDDFNAFISLYKVFISILSHTWDGREKQCVTTFKRTLK
jgi:hypothetical protein